MNLSHFVFRLLPVALIPFSSAVAEGESQQEVPILLITSPALSSSWESYAEWKGEQGKGVRIVTTDTIGRDYDGPDLQEKIRKCVRHHIDDRGTKWVVLGGDSQPGGEGVVPDRDTAHRTRFGESSDIPTDIYYISPTNWDADGDGVYGEFDDDREAITYPDGAVGIGRIPVRTVADVKAYTDKVVGYESRYPEGVFRDRIVYTCTESGAYPKVRRSWDDHVSKVMPADGVSRYFADETPWDVETPGDFPLSNDNLVTMLNEHRAGKWHLHGHGLLHCWVLEGHQMFTQKQVDQLTNEDAYPVITTVSCFTGQFDGKKDPCISESMLRAPKAGAIAIVAPAREGKPHFEDPAREFPLMVSEGKMDGTTATMTYFWESGIKESLTTGEALMKAKARLAGKAKTSAAFHMCLSELNLLGDPTLAVNPK